MPSLPPQAAAINTMFSRVIAAIALLANAVSVDGTCAAVYDGKGATVNGVVLKEDADGVVTIPADWTDIPYMVSVSLPPFRFPANTLPPFCPSHDPNCTSFSFSIGV